MTLAVDGDRLRVRAPKGALTPELTAEIARRKADVLAWLRGATAARAHLTDTIPRRAGDGPAPLSFAQQRLWFLDRFHGADATYNIRTALRLHGVLDVAALRRALHEIERRHDALRTNFVEVAGEPVQVIAPEPRVGLDVVDLSHVSESTREGAPDNNAPSAVSGSASVRARAVAEANHVFDLARDPLLRAVLLRLGETAHVLLLTVHHVVADGWSIGVFVRELSALYAAFVEGWPSPLPDLPVQYADFAVWQRRWLDGDVLATQMEYWRARLRGVTGRLDLATDHPRPPARTSLGGVFPFRIDGGVVARLIDLGRETGATPFMIALAAYAALLSRMSGQDDLTIGVPVANRGHEDLEPLIGFFVNTVVMRVRLDGDPSFTELVARVRRATVEASGYQDLPYEKLVGELSARGDRDPFFQAMLIFENASGAELTLPGLSIAPLETGDVGGLGVRSDIDLYVAESPGRGAIASDGDVAAASSGWSAFFCYRRDLFADAAVRRMAARLRALLQDAARDPGRPVTALSIGGTPEPPPLLAIRGPHLAGRFPLSPHQERLWFIDEFETGNVYDSHPSYHNVPLLLALSGRVDASRLEQALNRVVARHVALRTRIVREDDALHQDVDAGLDVTLSVVDAAPGDDLVERALDDSRRPFDLSRGPLIRATLIRRGDEHALLAVAVHHIVVDRSSLAILADELAHAYALLTVATPAVDRDASLAVGHQAGVHEPSCQFPDYVRWQRQLPADVIEPLLFYWKRQLRAPLQALELPTTRPRAAVHTYTAARHVTTVDADLIAGVEALARMAGTSVFAVMLAAFKVLLRRYAGHRDIVVGTSDEWRPPAAERAVGAFANLLVLRDDLGGNPTFRDLLARVARTEREARAHRAMPFDRLVLALNPARDMSRTALFDVLFVVDETTAPRFETGAVSMQTIDTNLGYGKYDLAVLLRRGGDGDTASDGYTAGDGYAASDRYAASDGGAAGGDHSGSRGHTRSGYTASIVYNADYYDAALIDQMTQHFVTLLRVMTAAPESRIDDVALLDPDEEHRQRVTWNATAAAWDREATIHGLFEAQVARDPDRVAVVHGDAQVSYAELDRRANRLAHELVARGVAADALVGLCLDRSIDMVVAMLAVLKAGGAYVNLDPAYPEDRLRYIVADARLAHLVTTSALDALVPGDIEHRIRLDAEGREARWPATAPAQRAWPDNLAYCIHTSGSTGTPKGVLITHGNVVRLLVNDRLPFTFTPDDAWSLFHSYAFDFSVWEMYGALFHGGRLVVVPREVARDSRAFLGLLVDEQVTVLNQVPTAFGSLAGEAVAANEHRLAVRDVVFGGEALQPAQLAEWRRRFPATRLVNMYGITETTVHVTVHEVTAADVHDNVSNVGGPIPTTTTYLVSPDLRLLPPGVPGEIVVGGHGLARHYLNLPALTATRFVPDPFGDEPGARLYRSGDLARYRPDGAIEFIGRLDHQVKIRGYRIELGEIETALARIPEVREAVVVARENAGTLRLVAYIVSARETALDAATLRRRLAATLPEYMVPSAFVLLRALPLTPSGKVDRRALPAPGTDGAAHTAPATPATVTEELLARIWIDLLGVERVGARDDFFERGGHSLLAARLVSRIRDVFGVDLPLVHVFEASTLSALAERVEQARGEGRDPLPPIAPAVARASGEPLPLSFAQQRLWFLDRLEGPGPTYNVPLAVRLRGRLDERAVREALTEITRRHEALRTSFADVNGQPVQVIAANPGCPLDVTDLRDLPPDEREAEGRRRAEAFAWRPFDLASDRLIRAGLLRLAGDDHVLMIAMHHIVSDGWSIEVFLRELAALYEAFAAGRPSPLPALPIQYADYAAWQRAWLSGDVLASHLAWWRQHLAGAPERLTLPADRPVPPARQRRAGSREVRLDADLTKRLHHLGRESGTTLFMTLLAGFGLVLSRYSGQSDVVVGTPVAGRTRTELEPLIGLFVNTLALRITVTPATTVSELLAQVRRTSLAAFDHQDVPFEQLVEELQPVRDLGHTPLFQAMFVLRNVPDAAVALTGLDATPLGHAAAVAKFDVTLSMVERDGRIDGALEYDAERFDDATIARLAGHYRRLLEAMTSAPHVRAADLRVLGVEEHARLAAWNDTARPYPTDATLHGLFEAQVAQTPHRVALTAGDAAVTYAELNGRANRLARQLRRIGVGADVVVGIALERSIDMVVGLLAILKAGGAYLPLEPSLPADRLAFMLAEASAPVVLTQQRLLARLPKHETAVFCLDTDWTMLAEDDADLVPVATADHLAYVIYTSGSTGRPKGCMITHAAIVNRLLWMQEAYGIGAADRILQKTPFGFDVSVWELFWPLITGAALVVAEPDGHRDPVYLAHLVAEREVTVMHFVPSMLGAFLDAPGVAACRSLTTVMASGEALPVALAQRFFERIPRATLENLYGPTEAAVDVTAWRCEREHGRASVPIGTPIANTRILVLDGQGGPAPVGVPGELHIGGAQLARGYLGRPALTAERFVPDALARAPGARLYRTGDLARYVADGDGIGPVEYLGRLDHQVKIRGFRVELGEIEAALRAEPGIADAVALAVDDPRGGRDDKRIVVFFVPRGGTASGRRENAQEQQEIAPARHETAPDTAALRRRLSETLPDYMVPAVLVALNALPLTSSGKADRLALARRRLPADDADRVAYAAPGTVIEQLVADLWATVLGRERAGLHDDFFRLGGHSLLATQVISRTRDVLGVEVPVRALFEAPTVAGFAARVTRAQREGGPVVPPLRPAPATDRPVLSFAQQRLWFLDRLEGPSPTYNMPAAVRLDGPLNAGALERALREIVRRHATLRTTFAEVDGEPVAMIAEDAACPITMIDLTAGAGDRLDAEVSRIVGDESRRPFDLARDVPLRVSILKLRDTSHVLAAVMHHIASDGWSLTVFVNELARLYAAFDRGESAPLPPLPVQYTDYAAWQRDWLRGDALASHLDAWRTRLAGAPSVMTLPTDRPRPRVRTHRGALARFRLDTDLASRLTALARDTGTTPFMTLLAGFGVVLSRYSGQDDLVIGTPVANRSRSEVEPLIGFFANTLPLRLDLAGSHTVRQLLAATRQTCLHAYEHQDLPFERLVEELRPARDLGHTPLFQVMFVLQTEWGAPTWPPTPPHARSAPAEPWRSSNSVAEAVDFPGLTITPVRQDAAAAKFDLTLSLDETGDGLGGVVEYSTDLFDEATITRMADHYRTVLEAMVAAPEGRIADVSLAAGAERERLLAGHAGEREVFTGPETFHEIFEAQARRTPDRVAVVDGDATLTYAELDRRANGLAHRLRELGVRPEVPVATCLPRSADLVIGFLGVLKAGGVYVPLDATWPDKRVTLVVEDVRPRVVLARDTAAARWAGIAAAVIDPRSGPGRDGAEVGVPAGDRDPARPASPDNLAYVIYTSGSTGQPKGVMVPHRQLCNVARGQPATFDVRGGDRLLWFVSPAFDVSVSDLVTALGTGATLCIEDGDDLLPGPGLVRLLRHHAVTHAELVPSAVAVMPQEPLPALRIVVLGGEPCPLDLLDRWSRDHTVMNVYGPTETTIAVTAGPHQTGSGVAHIGRPTANTRIHLVDPEGRPVPIGLPGELDVAGVQVTRGYLRRPALTADRFRPDPFGDEPGRRLYRTGDLARARADGTLAFLGRVDHQVKVRGVRIEPGEIEAALNAHPDVETSVVVLRGATDGAGDGARRSGTDGADEARRDARLVAYVLPAADRAPDVGELRAWLRERLPETMVPSALVVLSTLPLTTNGKIDRAALPEPSFELAEDTYVAPRTITEARLASMWADALGLPRAGVRGSFFDLGGHSMLAVRLMAMVKDAFGTHLPLAALFQHPTPETFAPLVDAALDATRDARPWSPLVPIQPRGGGTPLHVVPGTGGNVVYFSELGRRLGELGRPLYGLQAVGLDGVTPPHASVEEIAAANVRAIREVQRHGPWALAGHSFGSLVAFEMARQLADAGDTIALVAVLDTPAPDVMFRSDAPVMDDADWIVSVAEVLGRVYARDVPLDAHALRGKSWDAQLAYLTDRLKTARIMPPGTETREIRGLVDVYRAQATIRYVPHAAIPARIVLFRSRDGSFAADRALDATWGWSRHTTVDVIVEDVSGDHISMLTIPHVRTLADRLSRWLESTDR